MTAKTATPVASVDIEKTQQKVELKVEEEQGTANKSLPESHPLQTKWSWWYFDRYNRPDIAVDKKTDEDEKEDDGEHKKKKMMMMMKEEQKERVEGSDSDDGNNGPSTSSSSTSPAGTPRVRDTTLAPPQRCESEPYDALWTKLCTFDTLEGFVKSYAFVTRPSGISIANLSLFRGETRPIWENYPDGGQWIVEMRKNGPLLDRLWEQLIFSVICEEFEEPELVGVSLSIRPKVDILSIWQKNAGNTRAKNAIGDKMKKILHLGPQVIVQYKSNRQALSDGRSYVFAKAYVVGGNPWGGRRSGRSSRRNSSAQPLAAAVTENVVARRKKRNKKGGKAAKTDDKDTAATTTATATATAPAPAVDTNENKATEEKN